VSDRILYNKPFTTVTEQIATLKARGLVIADEERAKRYLERIRYFRLSGYSYTLRQTRTETVCAGGKEFSKTVRDDAFVDGAMFSHVIDLYVFDKKLRLLFLDALERIEVAIRAGIAIRLGKRDPWAYLDRNQFHKSWITSRLDKNGNFVEAGYDKWQRKVLQTLNGSKEEFTAHFNQKYSNKLPIWEVIEVWDFGMLSHVYAGLKDTDKYEIAKKYGNEQHSDMKSWIRMMNNVRNICAHHGRLWNRNIVDSPALPDPLQIPTLAHLRSVQENISKSRIYPCAAIIKYVLDHVSPTSTWGERFAAHVKSFPNIPDISITEMQFPDNWAEQDIWKPKRKKVITQQSISIANVP